MKQSSSTRSLDPSPLLLAAGLSPDEVGIHLKPYGIEDFKRADVNLQAMAGDPHSRRLLATILRELLEAGGQTADPDQALTHWDRFVHMGGNRSQLFQYLAGTPRMLHLMCAIFGNSPSLSQTLIRDPLLIYWLAEEQVLTRGPSREDLDHALRAMMGNVTTSQLKLDLLRRFKRREMLRIGTRDLLRLSDVPHATAALSDLAVVLIQAAYEIVTQDLARQYGIPTHRDKKGGRVETGFAVVAMGKLGGRELNYSSDVDVIYVYGSDEGHTIAVDDQSANIQPIPNEEFFEYLARGLTQALTEQTQEGAIFRVDLRLRAEGSVGQLARPLAGYEQYYRTRGQGWERQALLKARPVAGDPVVGRDFLRIVKPFIFGSEPRSVKTNSGSDVIAQIKAMKAQIDDKIAGRGHERRNVKLGIGGIREIEFVVQAIQMIIGRRVPQILDRNTMGALARFRRHGLLSTEEYTVLAQAYVFLRDVEHKLQMVHDLQTHALPEGPNELTRCAIRLGYPSCDRRGAMTKFVEDHDRHTAHVHRMFRNLVDAPDRSSLLQAALRMAKG